MIRIVHPGSGIRIFYYARSRISDPGSRIPDSGVKKAPDPRCGSATLLESRKLTSDVKESRVYEKLTTGTYLINSVPETGKGTEYLHTVQHSFYYLLPFTCLQFGIYFK